MYKCTSVVHPQVCWSIHEGDGSFTATTVATLHLPPSKHRWISAVRVFKNLKLSSQSDGIPGASLRTVVLCGDRKGSLHVYHCALESTVADELATSYHQPVQSLRVHGPNGVTSIVAHRSHVYTAGRDGYCRKFALTCDGLLTELTKFKVHGLVCHGVSWMLVFMPCSQLKVWIGLKSSCFIRMISWCWGFTRYVSHTHY